MSFGSGEQDPFTTTPNPYAAPREASIQDPQLFSAGEAQLATRSERFAGSFIDGIIAIPFVFGLAFLMGAALVVFGLDPSGPAFEIISSFVGAAIFGIVFLTINGYLLATKGQSVGKLIMKTQIVSDSTGTILPFGPLVLKRYIPLWAISALPIIGFWFGMANAVAIFRANRKCIHDDIAGTKVIKLSR